MSRSVESNLNINKDQLRIKEISAEIATLKEMISLSKRSVKNLEDEQ